MTLFNFKKAEKQDEFISAEQQNTKNIIPEIIISSNEKNDLSSFLRTENVEHFFTNVGFEKYRLHFNLSDFEKINNLLDAFYKEVIEENYFFEPDENEIYEKIEEEIYEEEEKEQSEIVIEKEFDLDKVEPIKPKKTRRKLNRNTEIRARFTDEEVKIIEEKIKKSGLRKGEFIRKCLLEKEIKEIDPAAIYSNVDALLELKSEIGKVGGLLKSFIKPNLNNYNVTKEEMDSIKKSLNDLENLKIKIDREVKKKWQL